jgi:hypothetical protein
LIGVANIGKRYFDWETSTIDTKVADSSLLEIWTVSKYYGKTTEEIIKVSGQDKKEAYAMLLQMAQAQPAYNPLEHMQELTKMFKERELSTVQTPANYSGGVETIGDLSLKYYSDKALWPLIVWANSAKLSAVKSPDDKPDKSKMLFIIHFIP